MNRQFLFNVRRKFLFLILCFLANGMAVLWASEPVDFYSTVSSSSDSGMIKMTTDLFYNQLQALDGYVVVDKRSQKYDAQTAADSTIAFYAEIQEDSDGSWVCTLNAIKASEHKNINETKKYASYYKILLDAKSSLENLFRNLAANIDTVPEEIPSGRNTDNAGGASGITGTSSGTAGVTGSGTGSGGAAGSEGSESASAAAQGIDDLAGTWKGEDFIEKVLILRGGRGFVIFKNGANMNVSVTLEGNTVFIKQAGSPNASFFPEIPRELALKNAPSAKPVEWTLSMDGSGKLTGTKKTLVADTASSTGVKQGTMSVTWVKN